METSAPLKNARDAEAFIFAGNARVTLVSRATGARYTFKVKALPPTVYSSAERAYIPQPGAPVDTWMVSLLTGTDNQSSYTYVGVASPKYLLKLTKKSRYTPESKPFRAFRYVQGNLFQGVIPGDVEIWHEGRCGKCNRVLTVPESLATGFGPECARSKAV